MVKLICFLKRKPGMSVEEFHTYLREVHAEVVKSTRSGQHALRYEQNHRTEADYKRDPDGFDGVTEQWFTSVEDFWASVREDDYKVIDEDQRKFLDMDNIVFILTEDAEIIVG